MLVRISCLAPGLELSVAGVTVEFVLARSWIHLVSWLDTCSARRLEPGSLVPRFHLEMWSLKMGRLLLFALTACGVYVVMKHGFWDGVRPQDQLLWAALLPAVYLFGMALLKD